MTSNQPSRSKSTGGAPLRAARGKRAEILAVATERFGRDGFEHTLWADVAGDVGVGPTGLYHYFSSKQHCLYVIMDQAIEDFRARFAAVSAGHADPADALIAVLEDCFRLSEQDVQRNRLLAAEQGLLATPRTSPREEEARQAARARTRDLEFAWATFLSNAMQQGAVPATDPRLLMRAVLGLYNSIWHWYRPDGILPLESVAEFYIARILAMIGVPAVAERQRSAHEDARRIAPTPSRSSPA